MEDKMLILTFKEREAERERSEEGEWNRMMRDPVSLRC